MMKPKLTNRQIRTWIDALKQTLDTYDSFESRRGKVCCSLCDLSSSKDKIANSSKDCKCIWVYFTGKSCLGYSKEKFGNEYAMDFSLGNVLLNQEWMKMRVPQIKRWIARLEKML